MNNFLHNRFLQAAGSLLFAVLVLAPVAAAASTRESWRFTVYLDDKEIGYHHFHLDSSDSHTTLNAEARFDVAFFKIPVFTYRHSNRETWRNRCLQSIDSSTRKNSQRYRVSGSATADGFMLSTHEGEQSLPACISTFAYWDPDFLDNSHLLNPQTGEYLNVEVSYLGENPAPAHTGNRVADHYLLRAGTLEIELWYRDNHHWLALQSVTENGRRVRYIQE